MTLKAGRGDWLGRIGLRQTVAQVGHACLEAGRCFQPENGCNLVVLTVDDQIELARVIDRLAAIDIRCAAFYEPDDDFGLTAICTDPINDSRRRFFRHYQLWSGSASARGPPLTAHLKRTDGTDAIIRNDSGKDSTLLIVGLLPHEHQVTLDAEHCPQILIVTRLTHPIDQYPITAD
jgi:hypothetical protein